ncbi:MAG: tetratricopeptide repeat protein [Saprospiraceae bacterium]
MNFKQLITSIAFLVTIVAFSNFTIVDPEPPTREEALAAYNEGVKLQKTDPAKAIQLLEKAVTIAEKLDSNGLDILTKSTKRIPGLYYNVSAGMAKQKKYDEAIKSFKKTIEVAEKYESKKIVDASNKTLYKMYYAKGSQSLKKKSYDAAIADFDQALELQPEYTKAMYSKGVALKNKGEIDNALGQFDLVIEKSTAKNNKKMASRANKAAFNALKVAGKKANKAGKSQDAIKYMNMALEKYKISGKDAADTNKKLAGLYFQLGKAYWAKKDKGNACKAYKKALYGQYKKNAEYELKNVVKCN